MNVPAIHDGAGAALQACGGCLHVQRSRDDAHARAFQRRGLHQLVEDGIHARHAGVHVLERFGDSRCRWNQRLQIPRGHAHRGHRITQIVREPAQILFALLAQMLNTLDDRADGVRALGDLSSRSRVQSCWR